jgi:hypothetical protein
MEKKAQTVMNLSESVDESLTWIRWYLENIVKEMTRQLTNREQEVAGLRQKLEDARWKRISNSLINCSPILKSETMILNGIKRHTNKEVS